MVEKAKKTIVEYNLDKNVGIPEPGAKRMGGKEQELTKLHPREQGVKIMRVYLMYGPQQPDGTYLPLTCT